MEMTILKPGDVLVPPPLQYSRTSSETSGSERGAGVGSDRRRDDRRRDDRRRGRLNSELLTAVLIGDNREVNKRLDTGASVNATCRHTYTTVLHLAVACGHVETTQLLLSRGASVRQRDSAGRQAVHIAAATGSLLLLQLLLDADPETINSQVAGSSQDSVDKSCLDSWGHDHDAVAAKIPKLYPGSTPLHVATQRLQLNCVQELLQRGARVDIPDQRGLTPLDVVGEIPTAPSKDIQVDLADALTTSDETLARIENLKERISRNPTIKARQIKVRVPSDPDHDQNKPSPVRFAEPPDMSNRGLFDGPPSPPMVLPNAFRPTDPSIIITPSSPSRTTGPSLAQRVVNQLINNGARMSKSTVIVKPGGIHNQVSVPMTCLHTAVEREDLPLIEFLLEQGACQLTWNNEGLTALHLAVSRRLLEPLRILLDNNRAVQVVDARDSSGRTPLHLAVAEEWISGVSLLLESGADVKVTSNDNQTVLHIAAKQADPQLLEELLTIPDSIKIVDSRNNQHETALFCAVAVGQLPCVNVLLKKGADITTSLPGDITLLHVAAEQGNKPILETLLRDRKMAGFKNVRSKEGKGGTSALHLAALHGYVDCVQTLIGAGCDLLAVTTICPHYGSTALHLAAIKGHCKVVECIVKSNKNTLWVKNADGWYPLHVAARFARKDCAKYMLQNGANLAATIVDSGGYKKTALDIIVYSILHPVSFLENIFDSFIQVNEYPLNNPKCLVKVNYDLLQPLGPERKQLKVLDALLNCGKHNIKEKLLLHPLIETFLYLKWKKLRVFFFLIMALYMIFTISLTTMSMFYYVFKTESTAVDICIHTCRVTLCVSLTLITLQELLQATRMQRYYLQDLESWVKWSSFLLATVVVVGRHPADWLTHVSAVAVLLSWLELLFLLSRWPAALGFYILMFFTVAKNVIRVLATFTFVILGFTFAFMIHFEAKDPFVNWWESLVKVMVMALEFDYGDLFEKGSTLTTTSIVGRSIFLSFMVLVAIVLMNLLVGLAVSDIATLEKQGRAQRLAKQIDFLSLLEMFVYNRKIFACCPSKIFESVKKCRAAQGSLTIEPGKPLRKSRNLITQQLRQTVISSIINRDKKGDENDCDDIADDDRDSSVDSDTSSECSVPLIKKEDKKEGNETTEPDNEVKNSLRLIMNELASIRQELSDIKLKGAMAPMVYHPPTEEGLRLYRT